MSSELESAAWHRNQIRALAQEEDAIRGHTPGTTIGDLQSRYGKWLHEASVADLKAMLSEMKIPGMGE